MPAEAGAPGDEPVRCRCGTVLLENLDEDTVTVGEDTIRFRRTTDFIACEACGNLYQIDDLRPGVNEHGVEDSPAGDALEELRALSQEFGVEELETDPDVGPGPG